ncbi:MAG: hypothetical protein ACR2KK_11135 [Acidimicrobiales bacterium]
MPRKSRWYDALPEATATVDCDGAPHPVTWRRGKVVLEAHDLSSERAMLVFGGELCPCMRVLEMWVEQFRMPADLFAAMPTWLGANAFLLPAELALPRRMAMVVSWERLWRKESWLQSKQAKLLSAELTDKALPPLRQHVNAWKPKTGARVVSGCKVALLPTVESPTIEGSTDRVAMRVVAKLHGRWLVDVWPRGIAVVDDAFVVELEEALSLNDLRVRAVRWEPKGPGTWAALAAPARVWRDAGTGGAWRLTWDAA